MNPARRRQSSSAEHLPLLVAKIHNSSRAACTIWASMSWSPLSSLFPLTASNMKVLLPLSTSVAAVLAQTGIFEPGGFNVTEALISNGVNVSAIPELAALSQRTLLSGCSIAVSSQSELNFSVWFAN